MGNFTFNETKIKGVYIIDVKTYGDNRGYFMETYKDSDRIISPVLAKAFFADCIFRKITRRLNLFEC